MSVRLSSEQKLRIRRAIDEGDWEEVPGGVKKYFFLRGCDQILPEFSGKLGSRDGSYCDNYYAVIATDDVENLEDIASQKKSAILCFYDAIESDINNS